MSDSIRTLRVAELLKHEIAKIIATNIKDPRVHDVVLTRIKVSKDLSLARVYFSSYNQSSLLDIQIGLEKSNSFIRKKLMETVSLKKLPQLVFERDDTAENASKIDELFKQISSEKE
ncbi:MAG: 30S ribosome-binding factor RbfA [Deferribacteraceae bacterium]|jgi:ribosome-binding factor A|nr:30S ribosome-binding factor RbfA [Deferribacteraceae bacterium]